MTTTEEAPKGTAHYFILPDKCIVKVPQVEAEDTGKRLTHGQDITALPNAETAWRKQEGITGHETDEELDEANKFGRCDDCKSFYEIGRGENFAWHDELGQWHCPDCQIKHKSSSYE